MRGGGCTHEPTSHIETRASRRTDTLRHANESITHSHCEVHVGIRSVRQHMGILTWARVHARSHTHTHTHACACTLQRGGDLDMACARTEVLTC